MSLRYKISLYLLLVITLYACISYVILQAFVFSSFLSLEKREAQKDILRCVQSLQREIHHLDTVTNDWAAWSDMYSFVHQPGSQFIDSNLVPDTFIDNQLDLICIYNMSQKCVWGQAWDRNSGKQITLNEFFPFEKIRIFFKIHNPDGSVSGVLVTRLGPVLVASRPITSSDHSMPARGYVIMGKFLSGDLIDSLREQTQVEHQIIALPLDPSAGIDAVALNGITPEEPVAYHIEGREVLNAFTVFKDIENKPALLFKTAQPRIIHQKGKSTLTLVFFSFCISGILICLCLLFIIRRTVISPLTKLTRYVTSIGSPEAPSLHVDGRGNDEIGLLYKEFAEMIKRIQNAHSQLEAINEKLTREILERNKIEEALLRYQNELREMSVELLLTEERERRRIAGDLHDRIGQNLAMVQIKLDMLAELETGDGQSQAVSELSTFMEEIISETRSLTFNISSPILYEMGLVAGLEWLAEDISVKYGTPVVIRSNPRLIILCNAQKIAAYRAVREILYNAMKHADATQVSVNLQEEDSVVRIEVSDNGKGFTLSEENTWIREVKFGLFSIRENLRAMGGSIKIRTESGQGTQVTLLVPLEKKISDLWDEYHES